MKGSYCQCHYCKCEHGLLHCSKKGPGGHKVMISWSHPSMKISKRRVLGRDIAMVAWRGSTAIVTTAGKIQAINFGQLLWMSLYCRCRHGYGLSSHKGSAVCSWNRWNTTQCSRLDKWQAFRRIYKGREYEWRADIRTKTNVEEMKDTDIDRDETKYFLHIEDGDTDTTSIYDKDRNLTKLFSCN